MYQVYLVHKGQGGLLEEATGASPCFTKDFPSLRLAELFMTAGPVGTVTATL